MAAKSDLHRLTLVAKLIAMNVRNEMENFHVKHLSDDQMKTLNPIIRNAIYSALVGMYYAGDETKPKRNRAALSWLNFIMMVVPKYWEEPELTDDLEASLRFNVTKDAIPEKTRIELAAFARGYLRV